MAKAYYFIIVYDQNIGSRIHVIVSRMFSFLSRTQATFMPETLNRQ
jgi:hypothetical protein